MKSDLEDRGPLPAAALDALTRGSKIQAIKVVRETHGIGLREAKDLVEAHVRANPGIYRPIDSGAGGGLRALVMLVGLAALAYIAWQYFAGR